MKYSIPLLLLLLTCLTVKGQEHTEEVRLCSIELKESEKTQEAELPSVIAFSGHPIIEGMVYKIMNMLVLPMNFKLEEDYNIIAASSRYNPTKRTHYIYFNPRALGYLDTSEERHETLSILAHEIGHHLSLHHNFIDTYTKCKKKKDENACGKCHTFELEADRFTGYMMHKMNISLKEAQSAYTQLSFNYDDSKKTHPKLEKRLMAVKEGYNISANAYANIPKTAEHYYNKARFMMMEMMQDQDVLTKENKKVLEDNYLTPISLLFEKAYELNPNFDDAMVENGMVYALLNNYEKAIKVMGNAIELEPNNAEYYKMRGFYCSEIGNVDQGLKDFRKSMELNLGGTQTGKYLIALKGIMVE